MRQIVFVEHVTKYTMYTSYNITLMEIVFFSILAGGAGFLIFFTLKHSRQQIKSSHRQLEQIRKEWAEAFDSLQDPVFLHDADLKILHANYAYLKCAGLTASEALGQPYWEVFPKMYGPFESCRKSTEYHNEELCEDELELTDGRFYASRSYPIYDNEKDDTYRYSIHILHDITDKKASQEKLRLAEIVFENTVEGILVTDSNGFILTVNRGFTEITGYSQDEVFGKKPSLLKSDRHEHSFYEAMWADLNKTGSWQSEIWNQKKDGTVYPEWLTITSVKDAKNDISHFIGIFSDLTEIKAKQEEVNKLANYDSLTALPNRLLLSKHLDRELYRAKEHRDCLAVLIIDLNEFAHINETLGHMLGDRLLVEVGQRFISILRPEDLTVRLDQMFIGKQKETFISRFTGDVFAVVLEQIANHSSAGIVAQRLLNTLGEPFVLDGNNIFITAGIGISIFPDDSDNTNSLLKCAHAAANIAKQNGRNHYEYYSKEQTVAAVERFNLESALHNALERKELFLTYQPQVSLGSGKVVGFEALLRWQHPEIGLISPCKFIPLAEDTGLILSIGRWVLRTACIQAKKWHDAGLFNGVMAVNASGVQILQDDLIKLVSNTIEETGIKPSMLELEITESAVMQNPYRAKSQLEQLKSLGILLAIDDFGTGYSSLSYLLKFPIDKLKIDRSFINNISTNPDDATLVRSIISMAKGMRLRVLAEGIETEEQLYYLKRHGCDELQGFYFSKPIDSVCAEKILADKKNLQMDSQNEDDLQQTLLLVDDEMNIIRSLERLLRNEGYRIFTANSAGEALQIMARHHVQVILSDQRMPETSGTELLKKVKDLYPDTIRMILSGYTDINTVTEAVNSGWLYKFLVKPFDNKELKKQILDAFDVYTLNKIKKYKEE